MICSAPGRMGITFKRMVCLSPRKWRLRDHDVSFTFKRMTLARWSPRRWPQHPPHPGCWRLRSSGPDGRCKPGSHRLQLRQRQRLRQRLQLWLQRGGGSSSPSADPTGFWIGPSGASRWFGPGREKTTLFSHNCHNWPELSLWMSTILGAHQRLKEVESLILILRTRAGYALIGERTISREEFTNGRSELLA